MNHEEKILSLLEQMQGDIKRIDQKVDRIDTRQIALEQKVDDLESQMREGFDFLERAINAAATDFENGIRQHEREYHNAV